MKNNRTVSIILAAGVVLGLVSSIFLPSLAPAQAKSNTTHVEKYMTSGKLAVASWFSEDDETYTN